MKKEEMIEFGYPENRIEAWVNLPNVEDIKKAIDWLSKQNNLESSKVLAEALECSLFSILGKKKLAGKYYTE